MLAGACAHERDASRPAPARNLIVYLVDTVRADHLGCYGYRLPTSPALDAFALEAVLFENAYAQSSWTKPAVASIFTGLRPWRHGANQRRQRLADEAVTLAEILAAAGYRTAGFITNPNVGGAFGFRQGFERYHAEREEQSGESVRRAAFDWLEARGEDARPFFLYLHTVEPHSPYRDALDRAGEFGARLADPQIGLRRHLRALGDGSLRAAPETVSELVALYDAEVAAADTSFGALLDELGRRGLADETIIVFVSDHGEEFADHGGFEHSRTLYEEVLRVPLIVRAPGFAPRRVAASAQHVDLLPTLLDLVAVP
jgi:arylsulfatase